jgi:hypothetical protein
VAGTCHGTRSAILCLHGLAGARRRGCRERRDPKRRSARVRRMAVLTNRESDVTTTSAGARIALHARLSDPSRGTRGDLDRAILRRLREARDEALELGGARPFATRGPTTREGVGLGLGDDPSSPCTRHRSRRRPVAGRDRAGWHCHVRVFYLSTAPHSQLPH